MAAPNNPKGSKPDKLWRGALMLAVKREAEKGDKTNLLTKMAEKVVELAVKGDMQAMKEIGDRLDGKPAQTATLVGDLNITAIERKIVDPVSDANKGEA